jgi:MFS family permease
MSSRPRSRFVRLFIVSASMSLGYGSVFTLLNSFREKFGFPVSGLGLIAGAGFFGGFVSQIGLSRFADRGYAPRMVRGGVIVAALSMGSMALATQLWQFVVARTLLGLASGATSPALRRVVMSQDPHNVGENLGSMTAFDMGGYILGPTIAAVLAQIAGIRAPFILLGAVYGVIFVLVTRLDLSTGTALSRRGGLRTLLSRRGIQSGLATATAFYTTVGIYEAVWAVLLADLGSPTWFIGVSLSLFTLPMVYFAPKGGRHAQRRGPLKVAMVSIGVASACMVAYGLVGREAPKVDSTGALKITQEAGHLVVTNTGSAALVRVKVSAPGCTATMSELSAGATKPVNCERASVPAESATAQGRVRVGITAGLMLLLIVSLVHAVADSFTMPANQVAMAVSSPPDQLAMGQGLFGATGLAVSGTVAIIAGAVYERFGRAVLFDAGALMMIACLGIAVLLGKDLLQPVGMQTVEDELV